NPVEGDLVVDGGRQRLLGDAEGAQETVEGLGRGQSLMSVIAVEVHVELGIGEAGGELVGEMEGQGSLAHPGSTGDGGDDHRLSFALGQEAAQAAELCFPAGEV